MIGATANLYSIVFPSLLIGAFAGIWSTVWLNYFPKLFTKCKLFDIRGIFHIHGTLGIWGGIASAITVVTLYGPWYGNTQASFFPYTRSHWKQGGIQILGIAITFFMSALGGWIAGIILRVWRAQNIPEDTFGDHIFFKMIHDMPKAQPYEM